MTIGNVTGVFIRAIDNDTVVLFDGEKNQKVKLERTRTCSNCGKEKSESEFRTFSDGRKTKMCDHCRAVNNGLYYGEEGRRLKNKDMVNHPPHYKHGGIETIDIIKMSLTQDEYIGYLKGNILKYRERAPYKGKTEEDYKKAKWYFDELQRQGWE